MNGDDDDEMKSKDDFLDLFCEYTDKAFDLENTLRTRLSQLPSKEFEGMLRPAFQEDEWMIMVLGGVLGVVVGTLQAIALGS